MDTLAALKVEIASKAGVAGKTVARWFQRHPWLSEVPADVLVRFMRMETEEKHTWLEAYESEYNVAPTTPPVSATPQAPPPQTPPSGDERFRLLLPGDFGEGRGLRREVEALEIACQAARAEWQRLASMGSKEMGRAFGIYSDLLGQWRQIAKDAPKALAELNDSVSKDEAQAVWVGVLSTVSKLMDALPVRLVKLVHGHDIAEGIEIAEGEIRGIKNKLAKGLAVDGEIALDPIPDPPEAKPEPKPSKPAAKKVRRKKK
jgi:hypothetical protein